MSQQSSQDVGIPQRIGHRQLRENTCRESEVEAYRKYMAAAGPCADSNNDLFGLEKLRGPACRGQSR